VLVWLDDVFRMFLFIAVKWLEQLHVVVYMKAGSSDYNILPVINILRLHW